MRIYERKKFTYGVVSILLGVTLITLQFLKGFRIKSVILSVLMLIIGIGEIYTSINKEALREAQIEESDERNKLISVISTNKAFHISENVCFVLTLLFVITGAKLNEDSIIGIGAGLGFSFSIMMFSDIFSSIYYERHM